MLLAMLALWLPGAASVSDGSDGSRVCVTGFIMDTFCIERGTLLDNGAALSLIDGQGPQMHSYHCLVDVSQCINSGFEMLEAPLEGSDTYCRILRFDAAGNQKMLEYARARGRRAATPAANAPAPGSPPVQACTTCTGEGDEVQGPSATVFGTISNPGSNPPTFAVESIVSPDVVCDEAIKYVPLVRNCASAELLPLFRQHAALMITSWGFLIPLGVGIALSGRHRQPLWFKVHRAVNSLGLIFGLTGWIIALTNFTVFSSGDKTTIQYQHAVMGCTVMGLGILQPLNALLRPHKKQGEARSAARLAWEVWHKSSGYIALVLSIATIVFGTRIIPVDNDIYRTTFTVLWVTVACIAIYLKFVDEKFVFKKVPSSATNSAKSNEAEISEVGGPVGQSVAELVPPRVFREPSTGLPSP